MVGVNAAPVVGEHLQHATYIRGGQLGVFVEHDSDLVAREAFHIVTESFAGIGIKLDDFAAKLCGVFAPCAFDFFMLLFI